MSANLHRALLLTLLAAVGVSAQTEPEIAHSDNFQSYGTQKNPAGWVDTSVSGSTPNGLYKTWPDPTAANNVIYGTKQSSGKPEGNNPRIGTFSTYTAKSFFGKGRFEYRGRFIRTNDDTRIGLTFFSSYPEKDQYYLVGLWHTPENTLTMQLFGFDAGSLTGTLDSKFTPQANRWYQFLIQCDDVNDKTLIRAKFWRDGSDEPDMFSIDAEDAASKRLRSGRIGIWSAVKGDAYIDDIAAKSPVDHTAPAIKFLDEATAKELDPAVLALFKTPARIEIRVTDDLSTVAYQAKLDGNPYASGSAINVDGVHTIAVHAVDGPGNAIDAQLKLLVDQVPPVIALRADDHVLANGQIFDDDVLLSASVTDVSKVATSALLDGNAVQLPLPVSGEQMHTIVVTATDQVGWPATVASSFAVDKTAPVVTLFGNGNELASGASFQRDVALTWTVTDLTFDRVAATLDGAPIASGTLVTTEAIHNVVVTAFDKAGHQTEVRRTFPLDKSAPGVQLLANGEAFAEGTTFNGPVAFTAEIQSATPTATVATIDDQPFTMANSVAAEGRHTIKVVVTNAAHLSTTVGPFGFTIDLSKPVVTLTESGQPIVDGMKFTRDVLPVVTATDNLTEHPARLLIVDGNPFPLDSAITEEKAEHTISATATDDGGNAATVGPFRFVLDKTKPIVTIVDAESGKAFGVDALFARAVRLKVKVVDVTATTVVATLNGAAFDLGPPAAQPDGSVVYTSAPTAADGHYTVSVVATDVVGFRNDAATGSFTVDTTPPSLSFIAPQPNSTLGTATVLVQGNADDAQTVIVGDRVAQVDLTAKTFVATNIALVEGRNEIVTKGTDKAGNVGTATLVVTLDTLAPELIVTAPLVNACVSATELQVSGRAGDPSLDHVDVAIGSATPVRATLNSDGSFTATVPLPAEGHFDVTVEAVDTTAHAAVVPIPITVDRTRPSVEVTSGGAPFVGGYFNRAVSMIVRPVDTDSRATVTATLGTQPYVIGTPVTADGSYVLRAVARDCAGNASDEKRIEFTIDTVGPKLTSIDPANGASIGASQSSIHGSVERDDLQSARIESPSASATVSGASFAFPALPLDEGVNHLTVLLTDRAGNETSVPYAITVKSTTPSVSILENGSPIPPGALFNRSVAPVVSSNESGAVITATLNGAPFTSGSQVTADGSYTLIATAADSFGHTSPQATATFTIDRTPPTVHIASPASAAVITADRVTVQATATDSAAISINGSAAANGSAVVPLEIGPNPIVATATDRAGNSASDQIEVTRDDGRPGILLITPADGTTTNRPSIAVTGQILTVTPGVKVSINGNQVPVDAAGSFRLLEFPLTEGDDAITAAVVGRNASVTVHVTADFTPPSLSVLANGVELHTGDRFVASPTLTIETSAGAITTITLDGVVDAPLTALSNGGHSITAIARDPAGNETRVARTFVVGSAGGGACALSAFDPPDRSAMFGSSVKLSGRASGASAVLINGVRAPVYDGSFALSVPLSQEGANSVVVACEGSSDGQVTLTLYRYTNAPSITIAQPARNSAPASDSVTVSGTVSADVVSGDVNGVAFTPASNSYSVPNVALGSGANVIIARAKNAAGRTAAATTYVIRDGGPQVAITSPLPDTQTGATTIRVSGTYKNIDPASLSVAPPPSAVLNTRADSDTTGTFSTTVPLSGLTAITVTGRNRANVTATASINVANVAGLPTITIDAPADNTYYPADRTEATVTGSISPVGGSIVQINGAQAAVDSAFHFSGSVPLGSGFTPIVARVTTPDGKSASDSLRVVRLTAPLTVKSSFPANDAQQVDAGALIVVLFSNPLDASTARTAVALSDSTGQSITTTLFVDDDAISIAPDVPLSTGTTYTLAISQSLKDAAGVALAQPFTLRFTTNATAPATAPQLDQTDTAACLTSATITGTASAAGARLRLTLDGVTASTTAGADRKFKFDFTFSGQPGYHVARVREVGGDGSLSPESVVCYRINCAGPQVSSATLDRTAKRLLIQFSKPMNAASLVASPTGTIRLGALSGMVSLNANVATVTYDGELPATLILTVTTGVQDTGGISMAAEYTQQFGLESSQQGGRQGFVTGAVYDATNGRPLPNAVVTIAETSGATDDQGRYARSLGEGAYTIQATSSGYTTAWRQVVVRAGAGTSPLDIRLTKRGSGLIDGGETLVTHRVELSGTRAAAVTAVGAQSLAGLLPLGWSPLAAASVDGTLQAGRLTFTLTASETAALPPLSLVRYDSERDEWRVVAAVAPVAGSQVPVDILSAGDYALVYADRAPNPQPAPPSGGAALQGVANPCTATPEVCRPLSRTFTLDPPSVLPSGRTVATLVTDGAKLYPSGTAVQATIDEQLNFADGRVRFDPPFTTDLLLYRTLAGDTATAVFHLAPTPAASSATLREGVDHIRINDFPGRIDRGALIGGEGGRLNAGEMVSLDIPTGATTEPLHATAAAFDTSEFSTIGGFHIAGGFTLTLTRADGNGNAPPLLKSALATITVNTANQVVVAEVLDQTAYGRVIRIAATTRSVRSGIFSTSDPRLVTLNLDGIVRAGRYLILTADAPIAFAFGKVLLGSGGPPAADVLATSALGVADVTRPGGLFALPVPAAQFTLRARSLATGEGPAATSASAPAADAVFDFGILILTAQPPQIVSGSRTPAPNAEIDANAPFLASVRFDMPIALGGMTVENIATGKALAGSSDAVGNTVSFHASEPLQPASTYRITVLPSVRATNGAPFGRTDVWSFSTRAVPTNVTIRRELIRITTPDANGASLVTGLPGALPAGDQALAVRRTRSFVGQYQATVAGDGSFGFAIDGPADPIGYEDAIDLQVVDAMSHAVVAVIPLTPFTTADGKGFLAPVDRETRFMSPDGFVVTVPAGAFDVPTLINVAASNPQAFSDVPSFSNDLTYAASISLQFDGIPHKRLDLELPLPPGTDTSRPSYLGYLGQSIRGPRVMIADTLRLAGGRFTTAPLAGTSGALKPVAFSNLHRGVNAVLPTPAEVKAALLGVLRSGVYAAVDLKPSTSWAVFDGVTEAVDLFWSGLESLCAFAFYLAEGHGRALIPVVANQQFQVVGVDSTTGLEVFTKVYTADPPGDPTQAVAFTSPIDSKIGPYPVFASPARVELIDLHTGGITLTSARNFEVTLNSGIVAIGSSGVPLPANSRVEVLNPRTGGLMTDDNFVAGHSISMPAAVGDRIILLVAEQNADPQAAFSIAFNEPIYLDPSASADDFIHSTGLFKVFTRDAASTAAFADVTKQVRFAADSGNRRVTITFDSPLQLGRVYRLVMSKLIGDTHGPAGTPLLHLAARRDSSGSEIKLTDDLHLDFSTRTPGGRIAGFDLIRGGVRDLALNGNIAFVSALDGGLQAYDISDPAALDASANPEPIATALPTATDFWAVASDRHGRVYATGLGEQFGVIRTYRVADFISSLPNPDPASPLKRMVRREIAGATISWRPGTSTTLPLGLETTLSDRPEAIPRKMQIALQDAEDSYTLGALQAKFSGTLTNLGGGFSKLDILVNGDPALVYQMQRVTVENRTLDLRWSADVPRSGSAPIAGIIARPSDQLVILRNQRTYGVVSLFGYGIGVYDLNAIESNDVIPPETGYKPIREQVAISNGADPAGTPPCDPAASGPTGAACPLRDIAFSPEALLQPTAGGLKAFALDAGRGVLDLNVTPPSTIKNAGGGLTLSSSFATPSGREFLDQPRLRALRDLYKTASGSQPFARFTSTSSYKSYGLIAGNQFGLIVVRLDAGALDWDAVVDVIWTPAGAYSVRVVEGSDIAVVVDGAGRVLLVDLTKIDESSKVPPLPSCSSSPCTAPLFPTAKNAIQSPAAALLPGADWTEVGANDPRIIWSSEPHMVHGTLPPLIDPSTGFLFTGDVTTPRMNVVAATDPRLRVVVNTGVTFREVGGIVPLGIDPPPNIVSGANGSLGTFRVEVRLPIGMPALQLAVESANAAQTPIGFPRAHLRLRDDKGVPDPRPVNLLLRPSLSTALLSAFPALKYQRGANQYLSPWIVAMTDPRATKDFAWPSGTDKRAMGCFSCDRPPLLATDPTVVDLWAASDEVRIRPETSVLAGTRYEYLAQDHRLTARLGSFRADVVRPSDGFTDLDRLVAQNPATAGEMQEQIVAISTGEVQQNDIDLAIKARGIDFVLSRNYSSAVSYLGPFGRNFDSPLFARIRRLPSGDVEFYGGSGRRDVFKGGKVPPKGVFLQMSGDVVSYPDNTRLRFDERGRLSKITDRNTTTTNGTDGNAMAFAYGPASELRTVTDATGRAIRFDYNAEGLISKVTDFDGRQVKYTYDNSSRLTKVEGPDPQSPNSATQSTTYTWGPAAALTTKPQLYASGQISSEKDGLARTVWTAAYDAANPWSVKTLTSGGGTWTFNLDAAKTTVVDPNAHSWVYARDTARRINSVKDPGNATTSYTFDAVGRLASITRPLGDQTVYGYSSALASGDVRPMGNIETITEFPEPGSLEAAANMKRVTTVHYGTVNLPTSVATPDGATTIINRDARGNPKTTVDASGVTTTTVFDDRGLLSSTSDPRTGTNTLSYDSKGYLRAVTSSAGSTKLTPDSRGNVVEVIDATARKSTYEFNRLDQLETERSGNSVVKMTYDAAGNVASRQVLAGVDAAGNPIYSSSSYSTDEVGRVRQQVNDGQTTTTNYDAAGNVTSMMASGAPPITYGYDSRARIATMSIGSRPTAYTYDENGQSATVKNARGNLTAFTTGGFGQSVAQIDPNGVSTVTSVDAANRPVDVRVIKSSSGGASQVLRWTKLEYDSLGRPTKEVRKLFASPLLLPTDGSDPTGATDVVTEWVYDDAARKVTIIDANGNTTVTENDELGRPLHMTDAEGNQVQTTYNANGSRASEIRIEVGSDQARTTFKTIYDYDDQNRLTTVSDVSDPSNPIIARYSYDERSNLKSMIDADGRETRYEYDIRGRLLKMIAPDGGETSRAYDNSDRLTGVIDPNGNETRFTHNADGNLETERRADGATWRYTYDENHNLKTATDPNGTIATYVYDPLDRLVEKQIAKGPSVIGAADVKLTLDDLGRVTATETDEGVKETFVYDSLDRQVSESVQIENGAARTVGKSYDSASNLIQMTYPSGLVLTLSVDKLNRLSAVKEGGTSIVTYADDGLRLARKTLANGAQQTWTYDPNARLQRIAATAGQQISYARTATGLKTAVVRADLGRSWNYQFDPNGSISSETVKRTDTDKNPLLSATAYSIDRTLNYTSITRSVYGESELTRSTTTTTINNRNQYTTFAGAGLSYDANGNLTVLPSHSLQYDAENRLARDGSSVAITYAGSGRKIRETVGGTTRDYVLAGDQVIEEYENGRLAARYVRGRDIDEIVRAELGTSAVYPLQDELGNVERLTDGEGATLQRYEYQEYGTFKVFGNSSLNWRWLFQGREYNATLGAYDFRARTLWPEYGRFGQEDRGGPTDHANLYQAFLGSGQNYTDPSGRAVVLMHGMLSSGGWSQEIADAMRARWAQTRADEQDVLRLVNQRHGGRMFGPRNAARVGTPPYGLGSSGFLDADTLEAGDRTADLLGRLRAHLDASKTRKQEPIHVIAHSHGSAILLAASRRTKASSFRLDQVIFAGSDMDRLIDLTAVRKIATAITAFYSPDDDMVEANGGAGRHGFPPYLNGVKGLADVVSIRVPNIDHFLFPGEQSVERKLPHVDSEEAWMTGAVARALYADKVATRGLGYRNLLDDEGWDWYWVYRKLREDMALELPQVTLPRGARP